MFICKKAPGNFVRRKLLRKISSGPDLKNKLIVDFTEIKTANIIFNRFSFYHPFFKNQQKNAAQPPRHEAAVDISDIFIFGLRTELPFRRIRYLDFTVFSCEEEQCLHRQGLLPDLLRQDL